MNQYQAERAAILAQRCECVLCGTCRGSGHVWIPDRMGLGFDQHESCDDCDGTGVTEECGRCVDLSELERAHDSQ